VFSSFWKNSQKSRGGFECVVKGDFAKRCEPFLFVFGDDRVTCHARAYVNLGEHVDA